MTFARWRRPLGLAALLVLVSLPVAGWADADADLLRGCDALSVGDLERAKLYFERVCAEIPTDPVGHIGLGLVYLHAGSDFRAEAEREFTAGGGLPEALVGLAWVQLAGGDPAAADLLLADAAALADPPLPNLMLARAYVALCRGDAAASRSFETAGRAQKADDALADCVASERYALLANPESAAMLAAKARDALRARAEANLGAVRLNPPRGALAANGVVPRWVPDPTRKAGEIVVAAPAEGGVVSGTVVIRAVLAQPQADARPYVTVQVDGRNLASTDRRPYEFLWDSTRWPPGPHTITVSAQQSLGDASPITAQRRCVVREAGAAVQHGEPYTLSRKRLALWLSTPRTSRDWSATLDRLVQGSTEIARQTEPSDFAPIRPDSGLIVATGPGSISQPPQVDLSPKVALFFDDGPNPVITPAILDILAREGIHASFFLVGKQCEKYPDLVRRIVLEGHTVGGHSYSHANLTNLYPAEVQQEVVGCVELIDNILAVGGDPTPYRVRFFRCPGGNVSATVTQVVQRAGLTALDGLSYNTWNHMDETPEEIATQAAAITQGAILLHNGDDKSVFVLPLLIRALRAKGCSFVTADAMMPAR